jgi:hypothetical protein
MRLENEVIIPITGRSSWSIRPPLFSTGSGLVGFDRSLNMPLIFAGIDPADYILNHSAESMAMMILHGTSVVMQGAEFDCGCGTIMCNLRNNRSPGEGRFWQQPRYVGAYANDGRGAHGGNILFHDGGGSRRRTVDALPLFMPQMLALGYEFVTVEQLYTRKGVTPCWFHADDWDIHINTWAVPFGEPGGCWHRVPCAPVSR